MPVIACKLPCGLSISYEGKSIVLAGANIGEDLENVSRNGSAADNSRRVHGFGLTEISNDEAELFTQWANRMTYKNGTPSDGKLSHPFAALENGSILGPFKSIEEARKECAPIADAVETGFEGLDAEKEGVEATDGEGQDASIPKKDASIPKK